jgi:CRISPR-associated protein Csb2
MTSYLCISIRFLQPYAHGRGENGEPEWPPSPLRAFQALVAALAGRFNERRTLERALPALQWLEEQPVPEIVAASSAVSTAPRRVYVPDNTTDVLVSAWKKGDVTKPAVRTDKLVRPTHLNGDAVHYLYRLADGDCPHIDVLRDASRSMTHLGWGIDMVAGDTRIISHDEAGELVGKRWRSAPIGGVPLRVARRGTLSDVMQRHTAFLARLTKGVFAPVPPLKVFRVCSYVRDDEPLPLPYRVFELRDIEGERFRYPHRRLIHIAGMVRHLAIDAMKTSSPAGVPDNWIESYIAGHAAAGAGEHRQVSYLPLPSIGHAHADPGVRRVMIVAPPAHADWLDHLARRLAGQMLEPLRGDEFAGCEPPLLVPVRRDNIARFYTQPANVWASVTPVILPGHDDHKPQKTRKLIEKALAQSGIEQPCEFEWGPYSRWPKSYSAHKYDREKRPTGYIRPDHLMSQTAVHLTLRFNDNLQVPGPLAIGAGRHCGFGLMAAVD